jgi:hypothetical protein
VGLSSTKLSCTSREINKKDLNWAALEGLISPEQVDLLWQGLLKHTGDRPKFDAAHVAYYFGAAIIIGAMTAFMGLAWEAYGGGGIFAISLLYIILFVLTGYNLWYTQNRKVPGGLLVTIAVCIVPLAIYGLQRMIGMWPQGDPGTYRDFHIWVKGSWAFMEVGTIAAGVLALQFFRFPFLIAPISFMLWYMSMDLTPLLFGKIDYTWEERVLVSFWFGLAMLLVAYWIDLRSRRRNGDFAFWLYLFGLIAFWGSLPLMRENTELSRFFYCVINVGLIVLSVLLQRKQFALFGGLGVFGYLSDLSWRVFQNTLAFPFALTVLGLVIIYLGLLFQRHSKAIEQIAIAKLPAFLLRLLPTER